MGEARRGRKIKVRVFFKIKGVSWRVGEKGEARRGWRIKVSVFKNQRG
jgi:hypothetical protein